MTPGEIERVVKVASDAGIKRLKLTGGEPLCREDAGEIVLRCARLMDEVSMTTNGVLLNRYASVLKKAGLKRLNINLNTLDERLYRKITGTDFFSNALGCIETAVNAGISPIKLNMVVMKGLNENEIPEMMDFTRKNGIVLQLIELTTDRESECSAEYTTYHADLSAMEKELGNKSIETMENVLHRRRRYLIPSPEASCEETAWVEVVRSMHNTEFCGYCTRIRVTADGQLKPCLLRDDGQIDLLTPLRGGASDEQLLHIFRKAVTQRAPYWR
jgi:cyclic pyranopterin phosphate synthase